MDIGVNCKDLFPYSCDHLVKLIQTVTPQDWEQSDLRQKSFAVHKNTQSIVYVWSAFADTNYQDVIAHIPPTHTRPLHAEVWKIGRLIRDYYGPNARITKLMLAKLKGPAEIAEHCDLGNLQIIHRCHLPIITNDQCIFAITHEAYRCKPNTVFEFNNQKPHGVKNMSNEDRIHLICDILE